MRCKVARVSIAVWRSSEEPLRGDFVTSLYVTCAYESSTAPTTDLLVESKSAQAVFALIRVVGYETYAVVVMLMRFGGTTRYSSFFCSCPDRVTLLSLTASWCTTMPISHGGKPVTVSSMAVAQGEEQKELVRKLLKLYE